MKLSILAALAIVIGVGTAAHAGCTTTSTCPADEQPATAEGALERRIENALKDLEIFDARALKVGPLVRAGTLGGRIEDALKDLESATTRTFKADQERLDALERKSGIDR